MEDLNLSYCIQAGYSGPEADKLHRSHHILQVLLTAPFLLLNGKYESEHPLRWMNEAKLLPIPSTEDEGHFEVVKKRVKLCCVVYKALAAACPGKQFIAQNNGELNSILRWLNKNRCGLIDMMEKLKKDFTWVHKVCNHSKLRNYGSQKEIAAAALSAIYIAMTTDVEREHDKLLSQNDKMNCEYVKHHGMSQLSVGYASQAIKTFEAGLMSHPYNYDIYTSRAEAYISLGQFNMAEKDAITSIYLRCDWALGYRQLIRAIEKQGNIIRAHTAVFVARKRCRELPTGDFQNKQLIIACENIEREYEKIPASEKPVPALLTESSEEETEEEEDVQPNEPKNKNNKSAQTIPALLSDFNESEDSGNERRKRRRKIRKLDKRVSKTCKTVDRGFFDKLIRLWSAIKPKYISSDEESIGTGKCDTSSTKSSVNLTQQPEDIRKNRSWKTMVYEASMSLVNEHYRLSSQTFEEVLKMLKENVMTLDEEDVVLIKYSYAVACTETKCREEMASSISTFEEILEKHSDVSFPLVYYGLSFSYFKQNRFKEGLEIAKTGLEIAKTADIQPLKWPEIETVIPESTGGKLKRNLELLIAMCSSPPRPDAVCRYNNCSGHYKNEIYLSDPDFKGFVKITCNNKCCFQYHFNCWKCVKDETNIQNDKDFLDVTCLTPDCSGTIIELVHIDDRGDVAKRFEGRAKSGGSSKPKKTKAGKKARDKKKKKEDGVKEEIYIQEQEEQELAPESDSLELLAQALDPKLEIKPEIKPTPPKPPVNYVDENVPFTVLRKEDLEEEPFRKVEKHRERKKEKKKQVLSLDEFLADGETVENEPGLGRKSKTRSKSRKREPDNIRPSPPELELTNNWNPLASLPSEPELPGAAASNFNSKELIKENLLKHMKGFFRFTGKLSADDPTLIHELALLDIKNQEYIADIGGIQELLKESDDFVVYQNIICLTEQFVGPIVEPNRREMYAGLDDIPMPKPTARQIPPVEPRLPIKERPREISPFESRSPFKEPPRQEWKSESLRTKSANFDWLVDPIPKSHDDKIETHSATRSDNLNFNQKLEMNTQRRKSRSEEVVEPQGTKTAATEPIFRNIFHQNQPPFESLCQKFTFPPMPQKNPNDGNNNIKSNFFPPYPLRFHQSTKQSVEVKNEIQTPPPVVEPGQKDEDGASNVSLSIDQRSVGSNGSKNGSKDGYGSATCQHYANLQKLWKFVPKFSDLAQEEMLCLVLKVVMRERILERFSPNPENVEKARTTFQFAIDALTGGKFAQIETQTDDTLLNNEQNPFWPQLRLMQEDNMDLRKQLKDREDLIEYLMRNQRQKFEDEKKELETKLTRAQNELRQIQVSKQETELTKTKLEEELNRYKAKDNSVRMTHSADVHSQRVAVKQEIRSASAPNSTLTRDKINEPQHSKLQPPQPLVSLTTCNVVPTIKKLPAPAMNSEQLNQHLYPKNSFEKLMVVLEERFPFLSLEEKKNYVTQVRSRFAGKRLTGLTIDQIVHEIAMLIRAENVKKSTTQPIVGGMGLERIGQKGKNAWCPIRSKLDEWEYSDGVDEPCVICHDELKFKDKLCTLECHHRFHDKCIKEWFKQESTCPTCRAHSLLPDEFPCLK